MSKPARMFRTSVPSQIILQKIFELLDQEQWTDQGVISRWPSDANRIARLEGVIGSATNWPEPFVLQVMGQAPASLPGNLQRSPLERKRGMVYGLV